MTPFDREAYRANIADLTVEELRDALVREAELRYEAAMARRGIAAQRVEIRLVNHDDPGRIARKVAERLADVAKLQPGLAKCGA